MKQARRELAKDPALISQVTKAKRQARKEIYRKEGIIYTVGEFDCPYCGKHVSMKCDGKRHWGE